jgi:ParB family chromosome partitioning protein
MVKKDPLGRGLQAILKDIEEKGTSKFIPVDQIIPNPNQPRSVINDDTIADLASSIKAKGILQPLIVKKKDKKYQIIAGERRYRAAVLAGLKEVPAIIRDADEKESLELALIENLLREDLNPLEVATVYEKFVEDFGYTHEEVAKRVGVDRSSVSNVLRLLKLPAWIRTLMREGKLTQGHGRVLVSLKNEREQKRFVDKVVKQGVSVRDLERAARKKGPHKGTQFAAIEEDLRKSLQTKVNITFRKKKGKIIIEFYSEEDLERITELITGD